jgi:hypothetical protein
MHPPRTRYNPSMTPDARRAAEALAADVRAVFGDRLEAVLVYGRHAGDGHGAATDEDPVHTLVLVDGLEMSDLEACARRRSQWHREGLATPLLVDRHEFARSLDVFPIEFGAIVATHGVVVGDDPFDAVQVDLDDLRRACEVQARAHLLHLREGYVEAGGDPAAIARLVAASAAPLRTLLTSVARLEGGTPPADVAAAAGRAVGHAGAVFADVIGGDAAGVPTTDAALLFPDYLAAVDALVRYVDRWSAAR